MSLLTGMFADDVSLSAAARLAQSVPKVPASAVIKTPARWARPSRKGGVTSKRGQYGPTKSAILAYVREHPEARCGEVAMATGLAYASVSVAMSKLRKRGEIVRRPFVVEQVVELMADHMPRTAQVVADALDLPIQQAENALRMLATTGRATSAHVYVVPKKAVPRG